MDAKAMQGGNEQLADMDASAMRDALARGAISALELTEACLARIAARDGQIKAWAYLDPDYARAQARHLDSWRARGKPVGPLHGVPIGIKDVIDTADMATENGTVLDRGRRPSSDANVVARLRQAGAVIMGKTVTAELAAFHPGPTANPHDLARTPGGSSSGSAAAVAAGMVPLAIGTQTNGSVIRPASFCGVTGFKPSYGLIGRSGVLASSRFLDTIGVFARSVEDAALLSEILIGYDKDDADCAISARPDLLSICRSAPPVAPTFAFVKTPAWDQADATTCEAFSKLGDTLSDRCDMVDLPPLFADAWSWHRHIMLAEMAKNYAGYYTRSPEALSPRLNGMLQDGRQILAADYLAARDWRGVLNAGLEQIFKRYDAIITPAAPGEAPLGLDTTGDPAFCTLWTFCGTPTISLPLLVGEHDLPIGVQLVGPVGDDARLLRTARWLIEHLHDLNDGEPA